MLYVYLNGEADMCVEKYLMSIIQPDAFENEVIRKELEDVEEIVKIEGLALYSKRHGVKSPSTLGGGTQALILCYYQHLGKFDKLVSSANIGDNVGKYLQELSLSVDMHVSWDSYLPMDWYAPILACDVLTGKVYNNVKDFQHNLGIHCGDHKFPKAKFTGIRR